MPGKLLHKSDNNRAPTAPEADSITTLKTTREFAYDRKLTLNSARRKKKNNAVVVRESKVYVKASPKCGWKIRLDGGEDDDIVETDWVAAVDESLRPDIQVPLIDLLKPGRAHAHVQKAGDFEFVPHVSAVIVLDEHSASEPEIDEPWEELEYDDDEHDRRTSHRPLSYAEIAAGTT